MDIPMPPKAHDVAIVFTPAETEVMCDAVLIFELMAEGAISDAVELTNTQDDGGYTQHQVELLKRVRDKIRKATEPDDRAFKEYMDERRRAWGKNDEDPST